MVVTIAIFWGSCQARAHAEVPDLRSYYLAIQSSARGWETAAEEIKLRGMLSGAAPGVCVYPQWGSNRMEEASAGKCFHSFKESNGCP